MTHAEALPPLLAVVVAALVLLGAALALLGSLGLLRLSTFYDRIHPPTMGTTMGLALVLAASALLFSALDGRPVVHEIILAVFTIVTTPVTFMLLVRAARHREPHATDAAPSLEDPASIAPPGPRDART
jgi:multicomponent K+:H+ antiporter subunit G